MSWFKRKEPTTIRVPFPADRISALSLIIPAAMMRGLHMRVKEPISPEQMLRSSFLNSYLCGYPHYLEDELDPRMGGPIRLGLLMSIMECSNTEAQVRFDSFQLLMERRDPPTWAAFRLAEEDGMHYFKALIASVDADDRATANLCLAIRGYDNFPELPLP